MNAAKALGRSQIILIIDGEAKSSGMYPLDSDSGPRSRLLRGPETGSKALKTANGAGFGLNSGQNGANRINLSSCG